MWEQEDGAIGFERQPAKHRDSGLVPRARIRRDQHAGREALRIDQPLECHAAVDDAFGNKIVVPDQPYWTGLVIRARRLSAALVRRHEATQAGPGFKFGSFFETSCFDEFDELGLSHSERRMRRRSARLMTVEKLALFRTTISKASNSLLVRLFFGRTSIALQSA